MTDAKFISIIMPIYNEENFIVNCIDSLLLQDYPQEAMEWIFVDGSSTDRTRSLLQNYIKKYPKLIKLLDNPKKTVPYAMNIGIHVAKGEYIIRLDAHADYSKDYLSKCVHYLNTTNADNVGGIAETKSNGVLGNCIAKMLSSKFGVGNSQFRTNGKSGFVDTVPFGAFRKSVFEKLGGYDERLTRNQDNEMNYRIRKNGGLIYLANDIHFSYYCRDTIKGLADMALKNGMWNVITMYLCPGTMGIRHFIPLFFLLSIILLPILSLIFQPFFFLLGIELALYFILDMYYSFKFSYNLKTFFILLILYPLFHMTYGFGSLMGISKLLFTNSFKRGVTKS